MDELSSPVRLDVGKTVDSMEANNRVQDLDHRLDEMRLMRQAEHVAAVN